MAQKPIKKINIEKKPTKYFKRSEKDKSATYKITKEINKKILNSAQDKVEKKRKVQSRRK